jgi:hypothetical protein
MINPFTKDYKLIHDVTAPPLIRAMGRKLAGRSLGQGK